MMATPTTTDKPLPPPPPPPGTSISIRTATPSDAPAIAALGAAVFAHTFLDSGCTRAQLQTYLDESYTTAAIAASLAAPHNTTLVAVEGRHDDDDDDGDDSCFAAPSASTIVGFALLNRATAAAEPCVQRGGYARPVELQRLYVALGSQGRGVGRMLMGAAEGVARSEGYGSVWLGVWERNVAAQGLYGSLGYVRVGEHVFDVGGDEQIDWILVKEF